jgi:uncharacterized protein YebE (UPF0316 family)
MPDMANLFQGNLAVAAAVVFAARIVDVSLGTVRTISLIHGRIATAVILGFFEVLVWITVVAQVISGVSDSPVLLVAYAAGFAAGNGVGIVIERWLAMGVQMLQMISQAHGGEIAAAIRERGQAVTVFTGEGRDGPVRMLLTTCQRRRVPTVIREARSIDPEIFYVVEPVSELRKNVRLATRPTGWRSVGKQK